MNNKLTFTQRAKASLERAEAAPNELVKRDQLHIAAAHLQYAERYERTTVNKSIEVNQLVRRYYNLGGVS
jgi:hypothetical protein